MSKKAKTSSFALGLRFEKILIVRFNLEVAGKIDKIKIMIGIGIAVFFVIIIGVIIAGVSTKGERMSSEKEASFKQSWLKVVYTVFLAIMVALFWGLGISAFYEAPKAPDYPISIEKTAPSEMTEEQTEEVKKFEEEQEAYMEAEKEYSKNVSMIALGLAVLTLAASMIFANRIPILSDGLLLGSIFTLIYSIIRGIASEDAKMRFLVVVIGIVVTIFVGWWKFIKKSRTF